MPYQNQKSEQYLTQVRLINYEYDLSTAISSYYSGYRMDNSCHKLCGFSVGSQSSFWHGTFQDRQLLMESMGRVFVPADRPLSKV